MTPSLILDFWWCLPTFTVKLLFSLSKQHFVGSIFKRSTCKVGPWLASGISDFVSDKGLIKTIHCAWIVQAIWLCLFPSGILAHARNYIHAMFSKSHIVCTNIPATVNHPSQLGNSGNISRSQVSRYYPRAKPGSRPSKERSHRPAVLTLLFTVPPFSSVWI